MFLSVRLQRIEVFYHPQFIISRKDSGSRGKFRCVKVKGGNYCWMCVTIEPSGGIVWETVMLPRWARDYFGKSLSFNTVRRCIQKCNLKLYYAKRKAFINFAQERRRVLWARSHLRGTESPKRVLWSDESTFQLVFGKDGRRILRSKDEKTIQTVINEKCKNRPLWWYGGASVPTAGWSAYMWRYHWYGALCWMERYAAIKMLWIRP